MGHQQSACAKSERTALQVPRMDSEAIYERLRSSFAADRDGPEGHLLATLPMKQVAELMRARFRASRTA